MMSLGSIQTCLNHCSTQGTDRKVTSWFTTGDWEAEKTVINQFTDFDDHPCKKFAFYVD